MIDANYERIISKIAKAANLEKDELERRVEAKRAKLSSLITKEGAAQIVAAELGINFDNEKLKIEELLPGMRKVNVVGKVINIFPVRTFKTKNGDESKVANIVLADDTSNVKVVLWDTRHISLIEEGKVSDGISVEIINGSMRENEIHLGSFSEFKISSESFSNVITERVIREKKISDFKVGDNVMVRAFVVQSFEPRFFYVCSECRKKVFSGEDGFSCSEHGKVAAEKRALMNIVLDDGTETIRAVLFSEALQEIGFDDLENTEALIIKKEGLLGKEMLFSGNVKMNKFFNNPEIIVDSASDVDLDGLIKKLEAN